MTNQILDAIKRDPNVPPAFKDALPATPVTLTPLQAAWAKFRAELDASRPRDLRALNSRADLQGRIADIEAQIIDCRDWLKALVEDTAQHVALAKRPDDIVEAAMTDMAGDIRGYLLQALDRNAA